MNRDHLRVVASNSGPSNVSKMETFGFAQVEGGLIILHNDKRLSAPEALVEITRLLKPALLQCAPRAGEAELKLRRLLPGDMGGYKEDVLDGNAILAITPGAPADPLFPKDRHQLGYLADGPKSVCAEIDGDGA